MKFFRFITFCLIVAGILSCNKHNTEGAPDLGYDYYPAKIKSYIIYDVDSVVYDPLSIINDTVKYKFQIKEKIDTLFTDNQGRPTIKIIRYKKKYDPNIPYSAMTWVLLQDVWMANKTKTTAEIVEENVRYIKLVFPAKLNVIWNGNAQNTIGQWDYKYTAYDSPSSYGNLSFQKTLTVTQKYFPTAISLQNYYEKYARGVGLIYKKIEDYKYKQIGGVAQPGVISEGTYYNMTINFYGVE